MVRLFVEAIPPVYLCCDRLVTAQDVASASRFQNETRRREHLAWRRIVRRELGAGVVIDYNDVGAPVVDSPNIYISVSHGAEMVAVAIADEAVGIDIEALDRNFDRVQSRYMSDMECALSKDERWAAMVWCAKEAIYKLYGHREVDLVNDIKITDYNPTTQEISATVRTTKNILVKTSLLEECVVLAVATYRE